MRFVSTSHHLPHVDRMSRWNRPRDFLSKVANILENLVSFDVHQLFFSSNLSHYIKHCSRQTVWLHCDGYKFHVCNSALLLLYVCVVFRHWRIVFLISDKIIQHHSFQHFVFGIKISHSTTVIVAWLRRQ